MKRIELHDYKLYRRQEIRCLAFTQSGPGEARDRGNPLPEREGIPAITANNLDEFIGIHFCRFVQKIGPGSGKFRERQIGLAYTTGDRARVPAVVAETPELGVQDSTNATV